MSATELKRLLRQHSDDTGIPVRELRRMCTRAGIELLAKGKLVARSVNPPTPPEPGK